MLHHHGSNLDGFEGSTELDAIVPAQFHPEPRTLDDPERYLRFAVLEDAIRQLQRYAGATTGRERALHDEALGWFDSPDRSEPFSFENVCDALALDPGWIRRGLARWRAAHTAGVARPSFPRRVTGRAQPRFRLGRAPRAA